MPAQVPGLAVGAGHVHAARQVKAAKQAGARFLCAAGGGSCTVRRVGPIVGYSRQSELHHTRFDSTRRPCVVQFSCLKIVIRLRNGMYTWYASVPQTCAASH